MNFDAFMLPLILFLVLLKNYIVFMLSPNKQNQEEVRERNFEYLLTFKGTSSSHEGIKALLLTK